MEIPNKMKAAVYESYGPPEVLHLEELDVPRPKDNEVLIRVRATAVNSGDVRMRKADPFIVRLMLGLTRPKIKVLGIVFSGEVQEVGKHVNAFKVGDEIYGTSIKTFGAHAEYICLPQDGVMAKKPEGLTFSEAAVIPFGGTTALHFLRKAKAAIRQKVLIYGASGSVGTSAIQIAKHFGAEVTAVCSTANTALVRSLGADKVVDYTKEDFRESSEKYDIVFDAVGKSPFEGCIRSLTPKGYYLRVVHLSLSPIIKGLWISLKSQKRVIGGVTIETSEDLRYLNGLVETGELRAVIDRSYPLEQIVEAHRYVDGGHKKGNVAITVS